jgi:hypothetical protein
MGSLRGTRGNGKLVFVPESNLPGDIVCRPLSELSALHILRPRRIREEHRMTLDEEVRDKLCCKDWWDKSTDIGHFDFVGECFVYNFEGKGELSDIHKVSAMHRRFQIEIGKTGVYAIQQNARFSWVTCFSLSLHCSFMLVSWNSLVFSSLPAPLLF